MPVFPALPARSGLLRLVALSAALALGPVGARAQSLMELYEAARAYDATYQGARAQAQSVEFRAAQAQALNRPSVGASVTGEYTRAYSEAARTSFGSTDLSAGVAASMPLINGQNDAQISQADKSVELARSQLVTAEQDLIVRLAQAYFDVLAAQDALATTRTSKTFIAEQLASAKRNFEVGTATITDTREAQARFDLATAQEIAADNTLRSRQAALDQLVGRPNLAPRPLATPVVLPPVEPANVDTWLSSADTGHPSVRQAQLALDIARLDIERARAASRFTLDLVGRVGAGRTNGTGATRGVDGVAAVGLELNVPLYTGGSIDNRIKETVALEERSRNDYEGARRSVALATRQAFLGVQSGLAQVKALEAAESSTKLALEATQLGYKVGVRVNLDVLNAQSQLVETQRDLAKARYDVVVASLRLRQASGQLTAADLQAADAMLAR